MIPREEMDGILQECQRGAGPEIPLWIWLQRMATRLRSLFQAYDCAIYLRQTPEGTPTLWACAAQDPLADLVCSARLEGMVPEAGVVRRPGYLAAPVRAGKVCLGAVVLSRDPVVDFGEGDAGALEAVAAAMSHPIHAVLAAGCVLERGCEAYCEARQRIAELSVLHQVGQTVTPTLDLPKLLESVTRLAATFLKVRTAILRLVEAGTDILSLSSRFEVDGGAMCAGADAALAALVRQEKTAMLIPDLRQDPRFAAYAGGEVAPAMCAPLFRQGVVIGTLGLYGKTEDAGKGASFAEIDLHLLATLCSQVAVAIENARLFNAAEQRAAELTLLREIGRAVSSRLEISAVLEAVVSGARRLLRSQFAQILLWDEERQQLRFGAAVGPEAERARAMRLEVGRGVNGIVAATRQPMILDDYQASPYALPEFPDVVATITTPLSVGERLLGILHAHSTEQGRRFTPDDLRLLQMLADRAAIAIENARLFHKTERLAHDNLVRLRKISVLNEIGVAMQGTMRLDALLRTILTGVTFGGGLGFNRAILLLLDESRSVLQGRMGLGPSTGEEAARVWAVLSSTGKSLRELIGERDDVGEGTDGPFDDLARTLVVPLRPEAGVLALTALEGRAYRITDARNDPRVCPEREGRLNVDEFACVPLVAKSKVVGVIAVDNKFSRHPITDEDLDFLSLFATQAGLAIENAQVYTHLEEASREIQRTHHELLHRETLTALGEMAAHVVHEIRNPLVSIGGFARRLVRRLLDREPEGQYARIIAREVERLERIVQDVQGMSRDIRPALVDTDLHAVIQDCMVLFAERIHKQRVQRRLALGAGVPTLPLDPVQVKQAIVNLLANALDVMPRGGTLSISTRMARGEEGQLVDLSMGQLAGTEAGGTDVAATGPLDHSTTRRAEGGWVELCVGDTGGGISPGILSQVFDPFFTTKEGGTGLGLTLVRRIARAHQGFVDVDNRPGEGVTFRLVFPRRPMDPKEQRQSEGRTVPQAAPAALPRGEG
jgi:signal transduction histidine kinase